MPSATIGIPKSKGLCLCLVRTGLSGPWHFSLHKSPRLESHNRLLVSFRSDETVLIGSWLWWPFGTAADQSQTSPSPMSTMWRGSGLLSGTLWNLDRKSVSGSRKLPPMSTRNWSSPGGHFGERFATLLPVELDVVKAALEQADRKFLRPDTLRCRRLNLSHVARGLRWRINPFTGDPGGAGDVVPTSWAQG